MGALQLIDLQMDCELSPEQMEKALKLCDILGLDDFTVATVLLEQAQWNLQKVLSDTENPTYHNQQPIAYHEPEQPIYNYDDVDIEECDFNEYEYECQVMDDFENKKKMFNNQYISIPLTKTSSEVPNKQEKQLKIDRLLKEDYSTHRHQYQIRLLKNADNFYQRILSNSSPEQSRQLLLSKSKNQNNRKFLSYLHKKYKSRINFTFGTFMLNLGRSYLDNKYLLVYVHCSSFEDNKSIEMLLTQKQIANFINKNFIVYGMFDSSDDYEIVQPYVPMKSLPAFILFKFDKQNKKQKFVSEYIILQKEPNNFIEWLSQSIGLPIKKKEAPAVIEPTQTNSEIKQIAERIKMSDIINQQNSEYQEMQKLYNLKRAQSRLKKEEIAAAKQQIQKIKLSFESEPQQNIITFRFRLPLTGKSMIRNFCQTQKIGRMFDYISCFGRQEFEDQWADFDLVQTFPRLSLNDKKQLVIKQVFEESEMENIVVKEL